MKNDTELVKKEIVDKPIDKKIEDNPKETKEKHYVLEIHDVTIHQKGEINHV